MKRIFAIIAFVSLSLNFVSAGVPITGMINADYTINVPADFSTVQSALDYLSDKTMKAGITLTIQVADGTYNSYGLIEMKHPQGDQIHIVGNTTTPANCTINFSAGGFYATNGKTIGLIDGFLLKGATSGDHGVWADKNAVINLGQNIEIRDFNHGVYATNGANIDAQYVESSYNAGVGFLAYMGATINATNTYASYNGASGYTAFHSGSIHMDYATSEYNTLSGVHAFQDGTVVGYQVTARNNGQWGFNAEHLALVFMHTSTNTGNTSGATRELNNGRVILY
ncbi:MAG: hypothetical protein QNK37_32145 [Acidobacteriota bacterium]|nr:hypothetical protein [Acidobacteriota bacterium]